LYLLWYILASHMTDDPRPKEQRVRLPTRPTLTRSLLVVPTSALALGLVGGGTAFALGDLTQHYTGLLAKSSSGVVLGEIDTTTTKNNLDQRLVNDPTGDRQRIQAPMRDRLPTNNQGVYTKVDWYSDAYYCYVSGVGVGFGGDEGSVALQQSCQGGWHPTTTTSAGDLYTSTWVFTTHWQFRDGSMRSSAGELRVCEDEPLWAPDICSGPRVLGIDYD
jgi:hypothetical protein